jgi:hypothetical protein
MKYLIKYRDPDGVAGVHTSTEDNLLDNKKAFSEDGFSIDRIDPLEENPYEKEGLDAFGRGALQGLTLGFSDELPTGGNIALAGDSTQADAINKKGTELARIKNKLAAEGSPVAYGVGEFLGSIPTSLGVSGAGKKIASWLAPRAIQIGLPTIGKGIAQTAINPIAQNFTSGAVEGALQGAGTSEKKNYGEDAAKGAVTGGLSGLLGGFLGKKIGLSDKAAEEAFATLSPKTQANFLSKAREAMSDEEIASLNEKVLKSFPIEKIGQENTQSLLADANQQALDKILKKELIDAQAKALNEVPSDISALLGKSASRAIQSQEYTMPQRENLLSPKEYVKDMDAEELQRLIKQMIELEAKTK